MYIKKSFDYGPHFLFSSKFYDPHQKCYLRTDSGGTGWNDRFLVFSDWQG
jgi:hypothetical protein